MGQGRGFSVILCLQWAALGAMFPEKEVGGGKESGRTSASLLSYHQLLGTRRGAWNETRKPLIYISANEANCLNSTFLYSHHKEA